MVQYAKSLSEAIEKSTEQRKSMAPEPTQVCYKMLIGKHFTLHVSGLKTRMVRCFLYVK